MPRPRPPHLHRQVTRHGKTVWYVRFGKGPRVRIRAEFGTPEFGAEYQAAITGAARPRQAKGEAVGTLEWRSARHHETTAWTALSGATPSSCMSSTQPELTRSPRSRPTPSRR